jgi:hypothetical protein
MFGQHSYGPVSLGQQIFLFDVFRPNVSRPNGFQSKDAGSLDGLSVNWQIVRFHQNRLD